MYGLLDYFQDMCKYLVTAVMALWFVLVPIMEVESSSSTSSSSRGNTTIGDEELTELHIGGIFPINGKGGW